MAVESGIGFGNKKIGHLQQACQSDEARISEPFVMVGHDPTGPVQYLPGSPVPVSGPDTGVVIADSPVDGPPGAGPAVGPVVPGGGGPGGGGPGGGPRAKAAEIGPAVGPGGIKPVGGANQAVQMPVVPVRPGRRQFGGQFGKPPDQNLVVPGKPMNREVNVPGVQIKKPPWVVLWERFADIVVGRFGSLGSVLRNQLTAILDLIDDINRLEGVDHLGEDVPQTLGLDEDGNPQWYLECPTYEFDLFDWRELDGTSQGIPDSAATPPGGILTGGSGGGETTPKYASSDSAIGIQWPAANVDKIITSRPMDWEMAESYHNGFDLRILAKTGGTTDSPVINMRGWFDDDATATGQVTGSVTVAKQNNFDEYTIPVSFDGLDGQFRAFTLVLYPSSNGTDTLTIYGVRATYTRKAGDE